jgi:hypothetical protein
MDLFSTEPDKNINLLPKDGTVNYYGSLMPPKAYLYLAELLENIDWKWPSYFGKLIIKKKGCLVRRYEFQLYVQ